MIDVREAERMLALERVLLEASDKLIRSVGVVDPAVKAQHKQDAAALIRGVLAQLL